jgi:hypothetical protein
MHRVSRDSQLLLLATPDSLSFLEVTSWFHRCLIDVMTRDWVVKQSGWSFFGIISYQKGNSELNANVSTLFAEHSVQTIDVVGGQTMLLDPTAWQNWVFTIKGNPAPIEYTVALIADLFEDEGRKASMTAAVKDYLAEAAKDMEQLKSSLIPPTPYQTPSWCVRPSSE